MAPCIQGTGPCIPSDLKSIGFTEVYTVQHMSLCQPLYSPDIQIINRSILGFWRHLRKNFEQTFTNFIFQGFEEVLSGVSRRFQVAFGLGFSHLPLGLKTPLQRQLIGRRITEHKGIFLVMFSMLFEIFHDCIAHFIFMRTQSSQGIQTLMNCRMQSCIQDQMSVYI